MLTGKRYSELNPTITLSANSLLAAQVIGQPELNKITFQQFQNNVEIVNLKDLQGETLVDRGVLRYRTSESRFVFGTLTEDDLPNVLISKVTGLQTALDNKEPSFSKVSIVSTTILIVGGTRYRVTVANRGTLVITAI